MGIFMDDSETHRPAVGLPSLSTYSYVPVGHILNDTYVQYKNMFVFMNT